MTHFNPNTNKHKQTEEGDMNIQKLSNPQLPMTRLSNPEDPKAPEGPENPKPPQEKWDSVTFDSATNTYHFERPGYHYSASRNNPLREGLVAASLIGVPSALGAGANALGASLGGGAAAGILGGTALTAFALPTLGAVVGGSWAGVAAYKGTNQNPIFTGLAAIAGAGVGTLAMPLLSLPGAWGGTTGAVVATAGIGVGAAIWSVVNNHKLDQKAIEAGYKPQP